MLQMKRSGTLMAFAITLASLATVLSAAKRSPFLPPETQAAEPVAESSALEFRGVLVMGGHEQFNFFEPTKRLSTWVRINEPGAAIAVKSYDSHADTVVVEFGGQSLTLALQKVKISAAPAAPAVVPPAANVPVPQPAVVLNPTPADEAKRLDAIAAEVRRRRLLRQQTTTQPSGAKQN